MDVTLLRKLTLKSQMKFGKFFDLTVQMIIDLEKIRGIQYLVWCYYNNSKITFDDEVMEVLRITEDMRIKKPGAEKGQHRLYEWRDKNLSDKERMAIWSRFLGDWTREKRKNQYKDTKEFGLGRLQSKNHGQ